MKHEVIEEQAFIERYLRGDLPADDEERFEDHFMGCATCQQQLKLARSFHKGMRAMATEDAVWQTVVTSGVFAWLVRRGRGVQAGLAVAVLLVVLLPSMWLLVGQRQPASDADGVISPSVLLLSTYRHDDEPAAVLDLTASAPSVVLAVDVGDDARFESFRVTLDDTVGTAVLRREGLRPNALEVLMISFPTDFFLPGDYRLRVEGMTGDGSTVDLGAYSFRIVADTP